MSYDVVFRSWWIPAGVQPPCIKTMSPDLICICGLHTGSSPAVFGLLFRSYYAICGTEQDELTAAGWQGGCQTANEMAWISLEVKLLLKTGW